MKSGARFLTGLFVAARGDPGNIFGMKCSLLILLWFPMAWASTFVAPNPGPVPFRLDRVPLDIPMMHELSEDLTVLVSAVDGEQPENLRARAQVLALAVALNAENKRADKFIKRLERGRSMRSDDRDEIDQASRRVWSVYAWLKREQAGESGQALADCLVDAMRHIDPGHPEVEKLIDSGERGRWSGWVAPVAAFHEREEPEKVVARKSEPEKTESGPSTTPPDEATLRLKKAYVKMPIWTLLNGNKKVGIEYADIKMNAWVDENEPGLSVKLDSGSMEKLEGKLVERLTPLLEARHGKLPDGLHLHISWPGHQYRTNWNGEAISGAVAVLADAALSGKEPKGLVYAVLGPDGEMQLALRTWATLRAMALDDPKLDSRQRIILPADANNQLPYLLTTGRGELFFDHHIWVANDFDSLADIASANDPEDQVTKAEAILRDLKEKRGTRSFGGYVTAAANQRKLTQVYRAVPEFHSAKMLALRGTANWPRHLTREIYAREARAAVLPVTDTLLDDWLWMKSGDVKRARDQCIENMKVLDRLHATNKDRDEILPMANRIIAFLPEVVSARGNDNIFRRWRLMRRIYRNHGSAIEELSEVIGDAGTYPGPWKQEAPEKEDD